MSPRRQNFRLSLDDGKDLPVQDWIIHFDRTLREPLGLRARLNGQAVKILAAKKRTFIGLERGRKLKSLTLWVFLAVGIKQAIAACFESK